MDLVQISWLAATTTISLLPTHLSHPAFRVRVWLRETIFTHLHTHTLLASPLTSTLTLSSPPHSPPLLTTSRRGTRSRPGKLSTVSPPTAGTRAPSTASVPPSAPPRSLCRLLRSRRWRKLAAPSAKQGEHGELKTTSQNLHVDRSVYLTCFAAYDSKIEFRHRYYIVSMISAIIPELEY